MVMHIDDSVDLLTYPLWSIVFKLTFKKFKLLKNFNSLLAFKNIINLKNHDTARYDVINFFAFEKHDHHRVDGGTCDRRDQGVTTQKQINRQSRLFVINKRLFATVYRLFMTSGRTLTYCSVVNCVGSMNHSRGQLTIFGPHSPI